MIRSIFCVCTLFIVSPAMADIEVKFNEGAPKDSFVITNTGECALGKSKLTIDLSGSASGLIFDVTSKGGGVEVFQPFELVRGKANLSSMPKVADSDNSVDLNIRNLGIGQNIAFTIDVDDTMGGREITVSNSEIEGASVRYQSDKRKVSARFSKRSKVTLPLDCTS